MSGRVASPGAKAALVAVAVVVVDQITKAMVRSDLAVGEQNHISGWFRFVHVRNDGVAFSAFGGKPWIVVGLITVALIALLWYFRTHADRPLVWLATGLLVGGAVGNIIDRALRGSVTDFVKVWGWPAFNVADIAINVGVVVLVIALLLEDRARGADDPA